MSLEKKSPSRIEKFTKREGVLILFLLISFGSGVFGAYSYNELFSQKHSPSPLSQTTTTTSERAKEQPSSSPRSYFSEAQKGSITEDSFTSVAEKLKNSVVSISVSKEISANTQMNSDPFFNDPFFRQFFGDEFPRRDNQNNSGKPQKREIGAGTGFIITKEGLVLTNKHVASDLEAEYTVLFPDNTKYSAEIVAQDPIDDIAVLRIKTDDPKKTFTPVEFVDDIGAIRVGQFVVAIGNALGEFESSVTTGVISAKGRQIQAGDGNGATEQLRELLQTDAAINPGNSGGPLASLDGKVLGMNTAIASSAQGIGFALPFDQKKIAKILAQVEKYGKIVRPFLGVRYQIITPELNKSLKLGSDFGAWVHGENDIPAVLPNTPASKSGLKGGDIILKVNGTTIDEKNDLQALISGYAPGDNVALEILRDGNLQTISVTLEERKQ